jgi:diazepam-binding inhibitor (GABA receptor modulator, acyl-CoA-binding protein)
VTQEEAEAKYVKLVETLKTKYGYDADKVPEQVGGS